LQVPEEEGLENNPACIDTAVQHQQEESLFDLKRIDS
jgi:hypothetical protein